MAVGQTNTTNNNSSCSCTVLAVLAVDAVGIVDGAHRHR